MQISALNQANTSFGGIKEIKLVGGLKKSREVSARILEAALNNEKLMKFCNSNDVKLVLGSHKLPKGNVAGISVFFNELPLKDTKVSKFFKKTGDLLFGNYRIGYSSYGLNFRQTYKNLETKISEMNGSLNCQIDVVTSMNSKNPAKMGARRLAKYENLLDKQETAIKNRDAENFITKFIEQLRK